MTYASFNSELFQRFPQLKAASDKEFDYFGDEEPGCYLVFGILLVPEIDDAASFDTDYFRRLMGFVEEAASADPDCFNLVAIQLGEVIGTLKHGELIQSAAGLNTLRAITSAEDRARLGRLHLDRSLLASLGRKIASAIAGVVVWAIAGGKKRKKCAGAIASAIAGKKGKPC